MRLPLLQIYRDTLEVAFLEHFRKIILYNISITVTCDYITSTRCTFDGLQTDRS